MFAQNRAWICKCLRRPGTDSKESIPPVNVAWQAGTSNRVVVQARQATYCRLTESIPWNRFLGSLIVYKFGLCAQIPTSRKENLSNDLYIQNNYLSSSSTFYSVDKCYRIRNCDEENLSLVVLQWSNFNWLKALLTVWFLIYANTCTAKTKCQKLETNIPRKGISGPQSQFPHECVCERIIYSLDGSACSSGGNM